MTLAADFSFKESIAARLPAPMQASSLSAFHASITAKNLCTLKVANERIQLDLKSVALAQRQFRLDLQKDIMRLHIASTCAPAVGVSSDKFCWFAFQDNEQGIYMFDVTGQGIKATLLSETIGQMIPSENFGKFVFDVDGPPNPAILVRDLNFQSIFFELNNEFAVSCAIIGECPGDMYLCPEVYPLAVCLATNSEAHSFGKGRHAVGMFPYSKLENVIACFYLSSLPIFSTDAAPDVEDPQGTSFDYFQLRYLVGRAQNIDVSANANTIIDALNYYRGGTALADYLLVFARKRTHKIV